MKKLTLLLTALLATTGINAKVTLPKMFSDGMVMQRETNANLWGTAKASATVKITTSWDGKTYEAKAGKDGKWKTAIATPKAGGPYSITLTDGEQTVERRRGHFAQCRQGAAPVHGEAQQPVCPG